MNPYKLTGPTIDFDFIGSVAKLETELADLHSKLAHRQEVGTRYQRRAKARTEKILEKLGIVKN